MNLVECPKLFSVIPARAAARGIPVFFCAPAEEEFGDISEAIAREKEIKKGMARARKIKLVESINPDWKDLSEEW